MAASQVPYIPGDKLLIIYHTDTTEGLVKRLLASRRSSQPVPRLTFHTTYDDSTRYFLTPHEITFRATRDVIHKKKSRFYTAAPWATDQYQYFTTECAPEAVGNLDVNSKFGVAALNMRVPLFGKVGFAGYLHTLEDDISIQVPESADLEIIACAKKGVYMDGERVKNKPIVSLEEYFWKPTKKARKLLREFDTRKNAEQHLDEIRTRNRLYLLADQGQIKIEHSTD